MADGIFPTLVSRTRDANAIGNVFYVQLSDGTDVINITGTSLDVHITSTDIDIRDLDNSQDNILVYGFDGSVNQPIKTDSNGELQVDVLTMPANFVDDAAFGVATDRVQASGYLADEVTPDSVDEGDIGLARMTLDRKQLFVLVDSTIDSQRLTITAAGEARVKLYTHNLTNTNALPISKDNAANSETNPIYVQEVTTGVSGSEVHNYDTSTVAADTADNHDYTVTGTTFLLKSIIVAGSGNIKFEIQTGALASLVTRAVGFLTGRAGDSKQMFFEPAIEVPATGTGTVRIIRTNRENQTTDVYSTIIGNDV
jgi:hypothetical protein